jgi:hypothetical protein
MDDQVKAQSKLPPLRDGEDPLEIFRYKGGVEIVGDIMAPLYTDEEWDEFFEASCAVFEDGYDDQLDDGDED